MKTTKAKTEATNKPATFTLSKRSAELFRLYADDAANWSGMPLVGGNVGGSKADRGNLTQLKQAGLIATSIDEGNTWISFTAAGKAYALTFGIELENTLPGTETHNITITPMKEEKTMKNTKTAKTTSPSALMAKDIKRLAKTKTATAKIAKPTNNHHAFLSTEAAPETCSICGAAAGGKLHRRHLDTMRRMWRTGTTEERAGYLTNIGEPASLATRTWTELDRYLKLDLTAVLVIEESE